MVSQTNLFSPFLSCQIEFRTISGRSLMIALIFLWFSSQIGSHPSIYLSTPSTRSIQAFRVWLYFPSGPQTSHFAFCLRFYFCFVCGLVWPHHNIFAHGRSNLCPTKKFKGSGVRIFRHFYGEIIVTQSGLDAPQKPLIAFCPNVDILWSALLSISLLQSLQIGTDKCIWHMDRKIRYGDRKI